MPMRTVATYPVCECCLLVTANGDDSSCRDYHGHEHETANYGIEPGEDIVPGDVITDGMIRCFGCGDDAIQAGTVHLLAPVYP